MSQGSAQRGRTRVLLFVNSVAVGGMEEHVELIARHLDRARFEVFAVCPEWKPTEGFSRSLAEASDHVARITPDRRYGPAAQALEAAKLAWQIREWRIDVMHMHSTTYRGQYLALLAARSAGVRRVFVTEHLAPDADLPVVERVARDLFSRLVTGIVCVSRKNFEARARHLYTPRGRTRVVNNGVDLDDFPDVPEARLAELRAEHHIPAGAEVVGTAVRFEPEKGLEYLVDAIPKIRATRPKAIFLMVGDGSLRGSLGERVERLGLAEAVRFVGFQSDPRPYLALMDAFVLPVPVGSMSIGLLEAMAMRRASVITFGGEGEAVVHGESGYSATPRDPESIARYVIQILQDPALRRRLGEGAHTRVAEEFSAQRVARTLGELYLNGA